MPRDFKVGSRVETIEPQGGFHAGVIRAFEWIRHMNGERTRVAVVKYDEWVQPRRVAVRTLYHERG